MFETKINAATALAANGIDKPDNWGKLSTSRAVAWAANEIAAKAALAEPKDKPKTATLAHSAAALAKASAGILGLGAAMGGIAEAAAGILGVAKDAVKVHVKTKTAVPGEVYYNPKWKRVGPGKSRGWYPMRRRAPDPVPMTRQVARRKALDAGWPASEFRQFCEFAA